jgi:hypothetical protein
MNIPEADEPEEWLADALAAYDDRLAAGVPTSSNEAETVVDPALLVDWKRLTAFLSLMEKAWQRAGQSLEDRTSFDVSRATEAPPAGEASNDPTTVAAADDGQHFGRFQVLRTLGRGGFGIVFLAWDPVLRRQVALKVPQPESVVTPEARKRFQREAHAAAGLDHPNIVPVYEGGAVGTIAYIAAAYIPGPTLAFWLSRQTRPVPVDDAARLVATLARAVEHAHERGVLHRDLKPSNILLQRLGSEAGDNPEEHGSLPGFDPRITDFSLAKLNDGLGPDTRSGIPFGTPPYMAPEQAEGKLPRIGPPTDVYGLGCILYELFTGQPPFVGESQFDTLRQVVADEPLPPRRRRSNLPADLEAIVLHCLEKDPARRYPSARALAEDLDRFLADEPTQARPAGFVTGAWRWVLRPQRMREAGVIAMAYAVIAILWLIYGAIFVRLGIVFHLQRPAEFYRDALLVTFGDFVPTFWLGWKIRNGWRWAIRAGLAMAIVRVCLTTGGLLGIAPRFGDFYDNDMMRIAIYIALVNLAIIVFFYNLMALLAYRASKNSFQPNGNHGGCDR